MFNKNIKCSSIKPPQNAYSAAAAALLNKPSSLLAGSGCRSTFSTLGTADFVTFGAADGFFAADGAV